MGKGREAREINPGAYDRTCRAAGHPCRAGVLNTATVSAGSLARLCGIGCARAAS